MSKLLLYCTKNKWRLFFDKVKQIFTLGKVKSNNDLNGKIVAECDYEVEEIRLIETPEYAGSECNTFIYDVTLNFETKTLTEDELCKQSCLNASELNKYLCLYKEKEIYGYAIHIKNLNIFDEPKKLSEYDDVMGNPLNKAPQNMMYAFKYFPESMHINNQFQEYILISIQPQWMCLILNRIKDVEVRKVVLKEMIK